MSKCIYSLKKIRGVTYPFFKELVVKDHDGRTYFLLNFWDFLGSLLLSSSVFPDISTKPKFLVFRSNSVTNFHDFIWFRPYSGPLREVPLIL